MLGLSPKCRLSPQVETKKTFKGQASRVFQQSISAIIDSPYKMLMWVTISASPHLRRLKLNTIAGSFSIYGSTISLRANT